MARDNAAASRGGVRAAAPASKKRRLGLFNVSTGFDMYFFVLLMVILIIGLATL